MSYDIYIGNAVPEYPSEKDIDEGMCSPHPEFEVEGMTHPDAPEFPGDDMTGKGNSRHPGYSQFAEFCRRTGLENLFFDEESGLIRQHPGCVLLTKNNLKVVEQALQVHKAHFGELKVGCCKCKRCAWGFPDADTTGHDPEFAQPQSYDRARLIWFEWWMKWALENCEHPAMSNR